MRWNYPKDQCIEIHDAKESGMSAIDISEVLGISRQQVYHMLNEFKRWSWEEENCVNDSDHVYNLDISSKTYLLLQQNHLTSISKLDKTRDKTILGKSEMGKGRLKEIRDALDRYLERSDHDDNESRYSCCTYEHLKSAIISLVSTSKDRKREFYLSELSAAMRAVSGDRGYIRIRDISQFIEANKGALANDGITFSFAVSDSKKHIYTFALDESIDLLPIAAIQESPDESHDIDSLSVQVTVTWRDGMKESFVCSSIKEDDCLHLILLDGRIITVLKEHVRYYEVKQ